MLSAIQNFFFSNERFRFGRHRRRCASFNRERRLSFPELSPPSGHPSIAVNGADQPVIVSYRPGSMDSTVAVPIDQNQLEPHQEPSTEPSFTAPQQSPEPLPPPPQQMTTAVKDVSSNRQRPRLKLTMTNNTAQPQSKSASPNVHQSKKSLLTKFLFCCRSCCCCCCNCDDDCGSYESDTSDNGGNGGIATGHLHRHHHSHQHQLSTIATAESVPVPLTPAPSSLDALHGHQIQQGQFNAGASTGHLEQLSAASLGNTNESIGFQFCANLNTFATNHHSMARKSNNKPTTNQRTGQLDDLSMLVYQQSSHKPPAHQQQPDHLSFPSSSSSTSPANHSNRIVPTTTTVSNHSRSKPVSSSHPTNCDINQIDTVPNCQISATGSTTGAICSHPNISNNPSNQSTKSTKLHQIVPSSCSPYSASSSPPNWPSSPLSPPTSKPPTGSSFPGFFSNSTGPLKQFMMLKTNDKTSNASNISNNNNNNNNNPTIQRQIFDQTSAAAAAQTNRMQVSSKRLMKEIGDLMRKQNFQQQQQQTQHSTNSSLSSNSSSSSSTSTSISCSTKTTPKKQLFSVELVNDSLYEWYIKIYEFDKDSQIALDMQEYNIPYVLLHAVFPDSYPFDPPFVRVVVPYIERGYVMEGGAICLELLTKNGWTSAYTVEAVIFQLMASFVKGQARIKANKDPSKCFTRKSAENSFRHIVRIHDKHGWVDTPLYEG